MTVTRAPLWPALHRQPSAVGQADDRRDSDTWAPPHGPDCPCQPGEVGCAADWRQHLGKVTASAREAS